MAKFVLILVLISVIVSGCSSESFSGTVVGKVIANYSVDVELSDGEVRTVYLKKEQFYSGNFEVGNKIEFSCVVYNCFPE